MGLFMIAAPASATWFETRGLAALLTMRVAVRNVSDLILRSPPQAGVSKDEANAPEKMR
jgi:hypothetical protein